MRPFPELPDDGSCRSWRLLRFSLRHRITGSGRTSIRVSELEMQEDLVAADQIGDVARGDADSLQVPAELAHVPLDTAVGQFLVEHQGAGDVSDAHPSLESQLQNEPVLVG